MLSQKTIKPLNKTFFKKYRPKISYLGPFLFLFLSSVIQANNTSTSYRWIQSDDDPGKGKCYEYDIETGGQQYQVKVGKSNCVPVDSIFIWVADKSGIGGKCYQVDKETRGENYSSKTSKRKCLDSIQNFQFIQASDLYGECYQVISDSNRQKVNVEKCRPENITYHWLPSKKGWDGRCYEIDGEQGPSSYIKKTLAKKCRPEEISYSLQVDSKNPEGICYEVDAVNGVKAYSNKVKRSKCINKSVEAKYTWIKTGDFTGKCVKLQTSFSGEVTQKPTSYKDCIDFETEIRFIKRTPVKGICVLEDTISSGEKFRTKIQIDECRKPAGVIDFQFIAAPGESPNCYEVDAKTGVEKYIDKTTLKMCNDKKLFPKWFADDVGWRGKCLQVLSSGKRYSNKPLDPEDCKASNVKIMWHNFSKFDGACFEIDSLKGPRFYSREVEPKRCKPKYLKYVFYRKKDEPSGKCYSVDQETGGGKYYKRVGARMCKDKLKALPQTQEDSYHN